ncbi:putative endonuclease [Pedobacter sp. UYEF25]
MHNMKNGYVYIVSNKNRTTIYIGVTNDLERRMLEHKSGYGSIFTKRYNLCDLLFFEDIEGMQDAIDREKQLKRWHKDWKWNLIKESNPTLTDLAKDWFTSVEIDEYGKMLKQIQSEG